MNEHKLAVLIDADNVPYSKVKELMEEVAKEGTPTIKRIYADWTKNTVSGWKNVLLENAITPIQQYSYTVGKNSTDSAMIIDAMDILYSGNVTGFCIVSSDSDFTRLATRLREAGKTVFGFGEKKTPKPFISACDKFIYLENLNTEGTMPSIVTVEKSVKPKRSVPAVDKEILRVIIKSVKDLADETGWSSLAKVGNLVLKNAPDFDPRNYGFEKLHHLIRSLDLFDIDERESGNNSRIKHIYLKPKIEQKKTRAKTTRTTRQTKKKD